MVQSRFQLQMQNPCVFYTGGMKRFCFPSLYITTFPPRADTYQASVFCFDCVLRTLNLSGNVLAGQEIFISPLCMKDVWVSSAKLQKESRANRNSVGWIWEYSSCFSSSLCHVTSMLMLLYHHKI